MKTIALFGPTGMLGSAVYGVLGASHNLVLISRDESKLQILDATYGDVSKHRFVRFDVNDLLEDYRKGFHAIPQSPTLAKLVKAVGEVDAVINAVGITNRYSDKDPKATLFVNGAFPHLLAARYGTKLIHITTDCAYNGVTGAPYTEESPLSPNDLYGLSKAIGEPQNRSLIIRTSIIGPELHGKVSLIEWFKQQSGKTIQGYTNHYWNGVTTKQFGKICNAIISRRKDYPSSGLFHVYSTDVTKYEMLMAFKEKYNVNAIIEPTQTNPIDRRLRSVKDLCRKLEVPSFQEMLAEL